MPHILLPLALSFVTFQQIAFLYDCYKSASGQSSEKMCLDFIDYALFISFFPQLIAGPIVHHREMIPQFKKLGTNSACSDFLGSASCHIERSEISQKSSTFNYEFLAKGIFIFTIGLFKKVFIADTFAKWADLGFSGKTLNLIEGWASSLSYTFQLYFDFSGYCDMAMGLGLMFGIVLPLNFNSPYKALNIADFWRRWHISLGRFLKECVYIPLGGNRGKSNSSLTQSLRELEKSSIDRQQALSQSAFSTQPANLTQDTRIADADYATNTAPKSAKNYESTSANARILEKDFTNTAIANQSTESNAKILTLRNLFIVAILSGIWHGAGWGFVLWGLLHGLAMVTHRIYSWWLFKANSSLGNHCVDLVFRHKARTQSPLSLCQNTKNSTSKTADTRILGESQGDSMESNRLCEHSQNVKQSINANNLAESRRSEKVENAESAESHTESLKDSSDFEKSINKPNPHTASHLSIKHKITKSYLNFTQTKLYKCLCLILTFNFINIAWVFFRAENLNIALGVLKAMFGFGASLPEKWHRMPQSLAQLDGRNETIFYILIAFVLCFAFKNSFELMQNFRSKALKFSLSLRVWGRSFYFKGGGVFVKFIVSIGLFSVCVWILLQGFLNANAYTPFLYFNF